MVELIEDVTAAVDVSAVTTWLNAGEVPPPLLAVIESVPPGRPEVVKVAVLVRLPVTLRVAVPSSVVPL
jgi:hypothetical protein